MPIATSAGALSWNNVAWPATSVTSQVRSCASAGWARAKRLPVNAANQVRVLVQGRDPLIVRLDSGQSPPAQVIQYRRVWRLGSRTIAGKDDPPSTRLVARPLGHVNEITTPCLTGRLPLCALVEGAKRKVAHETTGSKRARGLDSPQFPVPGRAAADPGAAGRTLGDQAA